MNTYLQNTSNIETNIALFLTVIFFIGIIYVMIKGIQYLNGSNSRINRFYIDNDDLFLED